MPQSASNDLATSKNVPWKFRGNKGGHFNLGKGSSLNIKRGARACGAEHVSYFKVHAYSAYCNVIEWLFGGGMGPNSVVSGHTSAYMYTPCLPSYKNCNSDTSMLSKYYFSGRPNAPSRDFDYPLFSAFYTNALSQVAQAPWPNFLHCLGLPVLFYTGERWEMWTIMQEAYRSVGSVTSPFAGGTTPCLGNGWHGPWFQSPPGIGCPDEVGTPTVPLGDSVERLVWTPMQNNTIVSSAFCSCGGLLSRCGMWVERVVS